MAEEKETSYIQWQTKRLEFLTTIFKNPKYFEGKSILEIGLFEDDAVPESYECHLRASVPRVGVITPTVSPRGTSSYTVKIKVDNVKTIIWSNLVHYDFILSYGLFYGIPDSLNVLRACLLCCDYLCFDGFVAMTDEPIKTDNRLFSTSFINDALVNENVFYKTYNLNDVKDTPLVPYNWCKANPIPLERHLWLVSTKKAQRDRRVTELMQTEEEEIAQTAAIMNEIDDMIEQSTLQASIMEEEERCLAEEKERQNHLDGLERALIDREKIIEKLTEKIVEDAQAQALYGQKEVQYQSCLAIALSIIMYLLMF